MVEAVSSFFNMNQKHAKRLLGRVVTDFPDKTKILYVADGNANAITAYRRLGWQESPTPDLYKTFAPTEPGVTYLCYVYTGVVA